MSQNHTQSLFSPSLRHARKFIDTQALLSNYQQLKKCCGSTQVLAVVKCNAYGHGMQKVAKALAAQSDGFATASVAEALALRQAGITSNILVMQGWMSSEELLKANDQNLCLTVFCHEQLQQLEQKAELRNFSVWIKFDTGMNRLGFPLSDAAAVIERVLRLKHCTQPPVLMSHFACADEANAEMNQKQMDLFEDLLASYPYAASMANSSACLQLPRAHYQWVRPGIALYGAINESIMHSPGQFKPVMHLYAPIVAIRDCRQGQCIGYGSTYICPEDMRVGIAAIGYGDGYPWHLSKDTPIWVEGKRRPILGCVSMDLIAFSLQGIDTQLANVIELWGMHIDIEDIARYCNTISYELLTHVGTVEEVDRRLV